MKDILFDAGGSLTQVGESTRSHQQDILLMQKGWNKFYPHLGVSILDYVGDDGQAGSLRSSLAYELEKDGMQVNSIAIGGEGKIVIDATY